MSSVSFEGVVHGDLATEGKQTAKAIELFGETVELLMIKHGKNLIRECWLQLQM